MGVIFSDNIIVKYFDEAQLYKSKIKRIKNYDGPNDFFLLWNQLIILWIHNIIHDSKSLTDKFNNEIIRYYSKQLINEIDRLLFSERKMITLYYDSYKLKITTRFKDKIKELKILIQSVI